MRSRLALRPDLWDCLLEDRCLMATGPSPFLPYSPSTNSLITPGSNSSGGGGGGGGGGSATYPGPTFFSYSVGNNFTSSVTLASSGMGSSWVSPGISGYRAQFIPFSIPTSPFLGTGLATLMSRNGGGGGGSGGGGGGNNATPGTTSSGFSGYGSAFSSGFNFALSPTNNYGMTPTTLGSVPVHTFGGGGDMTDAPPYNSPTAPDTPPAPMPGGDGSDAGGVMPTPAIGRNPLGDPLRSNPGILNTPMPGGARTGP